MIPSTPGQQRALAATGNVLVMAGAGTGKTRTLVERCLNLLLEDSPPCSLDEILVVTFTEAAAAEMKCRLRQRLEAESARRSDAPRLAEQLALVDTAPVGTLHSICLRLIRDHFHRLGLDPQLSVLEESRAAILASETLTDVLRAHYRATTPASDAVRELILVYGDGHDDNVRRLVGRLHAYAQTLPDPEGWLAGLETQFAGRLPPVWHDWLHEAFVEFQARWEDRLSGQTHAILRDCHAALTACPRPAARSDVAVCCAAIAAADADANWRRFKGKTTIRKANEALFADAAFLGSLAETGEGLDPLAEDWARVSPPLLALVRLVREYGAAFARAKRDLAALDFHDLEQFALELLWDRAAGQPTALGYQCAERFRHVLVDEYQDINAAQDCLLRALSRADPGNRFLVGDVKQSIYRFRLANPHIFQGYAADWRGGPDGQTVALRENFRSHQAILDFVNALFAGCFRSDVGGITYDAAARLELGAPAQRPHLARSTGNGDEPRVELHLRLKSETASDAEANDDSGGAAPLSDVEAEAVRVARRLAVLRAEPLTIWDEGRRARRPVAWRDMVILLRAPATRAEVFAQVFQREGIPLFSPRGGFYQAIEISDLLSLLQLFDNPLQDLPLLAVLRSPLVGFSLDELAAVRVADRRAPLWLALQKLAREGAAIAPASSAKPKAARFIAQFSRWREGVRRGTLSASLEGVLAETRYEDWLLAQPGGARRRANVQRLLQWTRQFDPLQQQGLFRFLRFVEAQRELEFDPEPASLDAGDAVRLMSIHQSKGLEFPVVVVAALGAGFNRADLNATVILDERFGLAPLVKVPDRRALYPSLPHWLAHRRQLRELLGEEARLLYVAATRASERLVLVATARAKRAAERWCGPPTSTLTEAEVTGARSSLDWIGPLLPALTGRSDWLGAPHGTSPLLAWHLYDTPLPEPSPATAGCDRPTHPAQRPACPSGSPQVQVSPRDSTDLAPPSAQPDGKAGADESGAPKAIGSEPTRSGPTKGTALSRAADERARALIARLDWTYPHLASTVEPAKTSVTALRRRAEEAADEEVRQWFRPSAFRRCPEGQITAAERGVAHHRFMQNVALDRVASPTALAAEAARLRDAGHLTRAEHAALDLSALGAFWQGPLGQRIVAAGSQVRRELEFTARLSPDDLRRLALPVNGGLAGGEFVVVQGVADVAVLEPDSLWLVDFKTDAVTDQTLPDKVRSYAPQLALYALALARIHRRPATAAWLHFLDAGRSVEVLATLPASPFGGSAS